MRIYTVHVKETDRREPDDLKAVAVRGSKDINVADPVKYMELCDSVLKYIKFRGDHPIHGVPPILQGLGSPQEMAIVDEQWHTTNFTWGNGSRDSAMKATKRLWRSAIDSFR